MLFCSSLVVNRGGGGAKISQNKTQDGAGTSRRFVVDFLVIVTKFVEDGGRESYLFYYYMLLYYGGSGCNSTVRSELSAAPAPIK